MKLIQLILICSLFNICFCQQNQIEINKKIGVTAVSFSKSGGSQYSKNAKAEMIDITFYRENDSVSYFVKHYNNGKRTNIFQDVKTKINTSIFDDIVKMLNAINPYSLETTTQCLTKIYSASFGDGKYWVNFSSAGTDSNKNLEFNKILDYVWNNFEK